MCLQEPNSNLFNKFIISPCDLLQSNVQGHLAGQSYPSTTSTAYTFNSKFEQGFLDLAHFENFNFNTPSQVYQNQTCSDAFDLLLPEQELMLFQQKFENKFNHLIQESEVTSNMLLSLNYFSEPEEAKQTNDIDEILSEKDTTASLSYSQAQNLSPIQGNWYPESVIFEQQAIQPVYVESILQDESYKFALQTCNDYPMISDGYYQPEHILAIPDQNNQDSAAQIQEKLFENIIKFAKLPIEVAANAPPFYVSLRRYKRIMERRNQRKQQKKEKDVKQNLSMMNWHRCIAPKGSELPSKQPLIFEQIFIIKKKQQKYRYESRHKQASNRTRDSKGRFIGKKSLALNETHEDEMKLINENKSSSKSSMGQQQSEQEKQCKQCLSCSSSACKANCALQASSSFYKGSGACDDKCISLQSVQPNNRSNQNQQNGSWRLQGSKGTGNEENQNNYFNFKSMQGEKKSPSCLYDCPQKSIQNQSTTNSQGEDREDDDDFSIENQYIYQYGSRVKKKQFQTEILQPNQQFNLSNIYGRSPAIENIFQDSDEEYQGGNMIGDELNVFHIEDCSFSF